MEWLPIETAPTDGRSILIGFYGDDGEFGFEVVYAHPNEFEGDGWGVSRGIAAPPAP